jgi:predicted SprT family Zn-dependent metalloprotease
MTGDSASTTQHREEAMSHSVAGAQTTLDAFQSTSDDQLPSLPDRDETPTERQQQQLIKRAKAHARTVDLDVDIAAIEWEISTNAQRTRRAGDCRYNKTTDQITITLTWAAYVAWEWETFTQTIRHELVHAYQFAETGKSDHRTRFKLLAHKVDAPIHCQRFATGRLQIRCSEGCEDYRSKASKLVKHPETVRCRPHDASMTVEHVATGRTWTDNAEYDRQRAAIENSTDTEW